MGGAKKAYDRICRAAAKIAMREDLTESDVPPARTMVDKFCAEYEWYDQRTKLEFLIKLADELETDPSHIMLTIAAFYTDEGKADMASALRFSLSDMLNEALLVIRNDRELIEELSQVT